MKTEQDFNNVTYIDEYPHLEQKVKLKRIMRTIEECGIRATQATVIYLPESDDIA